MKPRLLLTRLCDLCHYSWKAERANRFPKILFIKKQTQWSNDKTIIFMSIILPISRWIGRYVLIRERILQSTLN